MLTAAVLEALFASKKSLRRTTTANAKVSPITDWRKSVYAFPALEPQVYVSPTVPSQKLAVGQFEGLQEASIANFLQVRVQPDRSVLNWERVVGAAAKCLGRDGTRLENRMRVADVRFDDEVESKEESRHTVEPRNMTPHRERGAAVVGPYECFQRVYKRVTNTEKPDFFSLRDGPFERDRPQG